MPAHAHHTLGRCTPTEPADGARQLVGAHSRSSSASISEGLSASDCGSDAMAITSRCRLHTDARRLPSAGCAVGMWVQGCRCPFKRAYASACELACVRACVRASLRACELAGVRGGVRACVRAGGQVRQLERMDGLLPVLFVMLCRWWRCFWLARRGVLLLVLACVLASGHAWEHVDGLWCSYCTHEKGI